MIGVRDEDPLKSFIGVALLAVFLLSCARKSNNSPIAVLNPEMFSEATKRLDELPNVSDLPEDDRKRAYAQLVEDSVLDAEDESAAALDLSDEAGDVSDARVFRLAAEGDDNE